MKIQIIDDVVHLVAETQEEAAKLGAVYSAFEASAVLGGIQQKLEHVKKTLEERKPKENGRKKHKRHLFTHDCKVCQRPIKGNAAMQVHLNMHERHGEAAGAPIGFYTTSTVPGYPQPVHKS